MYCNRYKRECEEALFLCCDVPSNCISKEEQLQECQECVFSENGKEKI